MMTPSMETARELVKDTPWVGTAGLSLLGVELEHWVLVLAALYGIVRLVLALMDLYERIDRGRSKARRDGGTASDRGEGADGSDDRARGDKDGQGR